jgi:hypothetical protein
MTPQNPTCVVAVVDVIVVVIGVDHGRNNFIITGSPSKSIISNSSLNRPYVRDETSQATPKPHVY